MKRIILAALLLPILAGAVERDPNGRIHRSRTEVARFKRMHPCPATGLPYGACPNFVIDHKNPLACGGADAVRNMQWMTVAAGKEKDKWERKTCGSAS